MFRNVLMSSVYFLSFIQFYDLETTLIFLALAPIIESILRLQFLSTIGVREFIILTVGTKFGLEPTIIVSSMFVTFVTFVTNFNNFIFSYLLKNVQIDHKKNNILIYVNNNSFQRTEDFYEQLKYLAKFTKNSLLTTKLNFNAKKTIIVENFVNPFEFIKIFFFLLFYKGDSYLIHTEFVTKTKNIYSFNDFDKNNRFGLLFSLFIYFLLSVKSFFGFKIKDNEKKHISLTYFQYRFFTTSLIIGFFDYIILAHPKMKILKIKLKNKRTFVLPYFFKKVNLKSIKKKIFLDFSGYLTDYRMNKLKFIKFNQKIFNPTNINKILLQKKTNIFLKSKPEKNKLIFSLHIEKTRKWPFSSPGRYYNSLKKGEIPVTFKNFNDNFVNITIHHQSLNIKSKNQILKILKKINFEIDKNNSLYETNINKLINQ